MRYELYYWPAIQGRGEYVRLALEEADADYIDVARRSGGEARMMAIMTGRRLDTPPFAPPFLKAGNLVIAQVANILLYLGARHGLAPKAEAGRLWVHQLQLTIADFVVEIHDTHHPLGPTLYYEDQRPQARTRTGEFWKSRVPKFLGYFEDRIARLRPSISPARSGRTRSFRRRPPRDCRSFGSVSIPARAPHGIPIRSARPCTCFRAVVSCRLKAARCARSGPAMWCGFHRARSTGTARRRPPAWFIWRSRRWRTAAPLPGSNR